MIALSPKVLAIRRNMSVNCPWVGLWAEVQSASFSRLRPRSSFLSPLALSAIGATLTAEPGGQLFPARASPKYGSLINTVINFLSQLAPIRLAQHVLDVVPAFCR